MSPPPTLRLPADRFLNREIGALAFNERVLALAVDPSVPLLEQLRFLTIVSSNLDEFFEIRVAGLRERQAIDPLHCEPDGTPVAELLNIVRKRAQAIVSAQYRLLNENLLPALDAAGVRVLATPRWSAALTAWARSTFQREILPVLTPIGLDPAHPFPLVLNKSLNFAVQLDGRDAFGRKSGLAIVQAPRALPRVIQVPSQIGGGSAFILLTSILARFVGECFPGMRVRGCHAFRVTRNSELFVEDEEATNLRVAVQGELSQRHFGDAVRLEVNEDCAPDVVEFLLKQFELTTEDLYRVQGPVNLARLAMVVDLARAPELKYPPLIPKVPKTLRKPGEMFRRFSRGDVLVHHPFESFEAVLEFLRTAAADRDVVAIKQTIYRTGEDSELMDILLTAARAGKEVTVIVELMARFDEETNSNWAARLEEVGAHVIYGVVGHKTHAKMSLVLRREHGKLRHYVHLSTGNYHASTAKRYTDIGLFTTDEKMCADVGELFKQLTGLGKARKLSRIWQSPFTLHRNLIDAIQREANNARMGIRGRIVAKMNSLLEPAVIDALYEASCAGVEVDLIVRGACALRPGMPGLSEKIRVRSEVGRFLEHSRIYYFFNGGRRDTWLASADWMDRNFFRRVEIAFPVIDKLLKQRVFDEGLKPYLTDLQDAWTMCRDGSYDPPPRPAGARSAQTRLLKHFAEA
jgi:polyphosphate kinase